MLLKQLEIMHLLYKKETRTDKVKSCTRFLIKTYVLELSGTVLPLYTTSLTYSSMINYIYTVNTVSTNIQLTKTYTYRARWGDGGALLPAIRLSGVEFLFSGMVHVRFALCKQ